MKQPLLTGMPEADPAPEDALHERRILLGLAHEWELACRQLEPAHRARMQKPSFRVADMTRLGQWSPAHREITLSRHLVANHGWDEVREVLRHEIAHQLADTVLAAEGQPPHGPAFQRACLMLRADPAASAAHLPLHDRLQDCDGNGDGRVRNRIRKLLSLARSANVHEAEAAMVKAHDLMTRHHLDALQLEQRHFVSRFLGQPALRHFREAYFLANLMQDFYFVQGIWVSAFVVAKGKTGRVLEISGTPANVEHAAYVFDFIRHFIDRQWTRYRGGRRLKRFQQSDFAVGIIEGFRSKLESALARHASPHTRAMVKSEDPQLNRYLHHRHPHTRTIQRGGGRQDPSVYEDGCDLGRELVIARGIDHKAKKSGRRLPPA